MSSEPIDMNIEQTLSELLTNSIPITNDDIDQLNIDRLTKYMSVEGGIFQYFRKHCWTTKMQRYFRSYKRTTKLTEQRKLVLSMLEEFLKIARSYEDIDVGEPTSLVLSAFRYYRYKWDREEGKDGADLLHEAWSLRSIMEGRNLSHKERIALLTAFCQSGKTFIVVAIIVIYLAVGETPVFVASNTKQAKQVKERVLQEFAEFKEVIRCRRNPIPEYELEIYDEILYHSTTDPIDDLNKFAQAVNGVRPRLILCIKHALHINRVFNTLEEDSRICLIIDEAHSNGAYKNRATDEDDIRGDKAYDIAITNLKAYSKKVILISATPNKILVVEPELYSDCVFYKTPGPYYRGLQWFEFVEIKNNKKSALQVFEELSRTQPIVRKNMRTQTTDTHPIIALFHHERTTKGQKSLLQAFHQDNPIIAQTILDANWFVMTFQGEGMRIWHQTLMGEVVTFGNQSSVDLGSGEHLFPKADPSDVLNWVTINGGVERFPRMAIISYGMADEGVSFSTHINPGWHLTDAVMVGTHASDKTQQIAERLSGNHGDDIRPRLWCCSAIRTQLIKEFDLTNSFRRDFCDMSISGNKRVVDYIQKYRVVYSNRIPARFLQTLGNRNGAVKVSDKTNPNAVHEQALLKNNKFATDILVGLDGIEEYVEEQKTIERVDVVVRKRCVEEEKIDVENSQMSKEEFNRLTTKMFPRWSKERGNMSNFLSSLNPEKIYTREEITDLCNEHNKKLRLLTQKKRDRDDFILLHDEHGYRLHPDLITSFNKYF